MDTVTAVRRQLAEALVEKDQLAADVEALCISQAETSTGTRRGAAGKVTPEHQSSNPNPSILDP
jgi:hypothetical protein